MGAKRKLPKKKGKRTPIKGYLKLLSVNPDPVQNLGLIRNAPDEVIKTICNAAYNLSHGSIHLTPKQKALQQVQGANHQTRLTRAKDKAEAPSIGQARRRILFAVAPLHGAVYTW